MRGWLDGHRRALAVTLVGVARTPFATALSLLALAAALVLPLAGKALLDSVGTLARRSGASPQLTLYLPATATPKDREALRATVSALPGIATVKLIPKEQALVELQTREGMRDLLAGLSGNPLPDALSITPAARDSASIAALQAQLTKLPGVADVDFDSAWLNRLASLIRAGEFVTIVLGALLAIAVVAVTFNTIRLQVLTRSQEIEISALFGATRPYLRRPFLYFGALQGLAAGLLAVIIVQASMWGLNRRLGDVLGVFGMPEGLDALSAATTVLTLLLAGALGWLGAWLAVSSHLAKAPA